MSLPTKRQFTPQFPIAVGGGQSSQNFRDYMTTVDALLTAIIAGYGPTLTNAANDAAAAAAGVAIGQFYRNGSVVMQRQT